MPHLKIEYTGNLDAHADMWALCAGLAFDYLNLRITPGRDAPLLERVCAALMALMARVAAHFAPLAGVLPVRTTLHIDEGSPVAEGKWACA